MSSNSKRLFFIDAMRAWAILMMLQGHFIDGLLDPVFRQPNNLAYSIWLYFRGITAPVFFTVSGFIFTYLLVAAPEIGWKNPRVKKGIRRGLQLLFIGYLLRLNLFGLLKGELYDGFFLIDVLQCIGLSILGIITTYIITAKRKAWVFPSVLISITLFLFILEPIYKTWTFEGLPIGIANYFTKVNGSVFTIFPWFGYATVGAFLSLLFTKFKSFRNLYSIAIPVALVIGYLLLFQSSNLFEVLLAQTQWKLFELILNNNYLFIRLGDVFLVFAVFMLLRQALTHKTVLKIGGSTLTIYVMHFILLYGSFTGLGLYKFLHHDLTPTIAIPGALAFMFICTYLSLVYMKHEDEVKTQISYAGKQTLIHLHNGVAFAIPIVKMGISRLRLFIIRLFVGVRS
ncbi:heparan-alpha-glucosaminide N-acetyltransferase domain-containing protein [Croceivirga sp. JEA036]|uniref:heparan-alpha-glucosaminide N-acetyltransferase domain-containing protein n=1 Tax=Croceivirga sp. JEA036 TaxID=2721162 RepID=UPI00143C1B1D|nr:heparan-alpha-glucosaminide N-acetyltransferase domain-containing protein [Croceivirga sp. JEA036]NJB35780.1 DUF1624 domain-containing protein [Croceivirga sp. JEA036]